MDGEIDVYLSCQKRRLRTAHPTNCRVPAEPKAHLEKKKKRKKKKRRVGLGSLIACRCSQLCFQVPQTCKETREHSRRGGGGYDWFGVLMLSFICYLLPAAGNKEAGNATIRSMTQQKDIKKKKKRKKRKNERTPSPLDSCLLIWKTVCWSRCWHFGCVISFGLRASRSAVLQGPTQTYYTHVCLSGSCHGPSFTSAMNCASA